MFYPTARLRHVFAIACVACLTLAFALPVSARKSPDPELTAKGESLRAAYAKQLETLSGQVVKALPAFDAQQKSAFLDARAALHNLVEPREDAGPKAHEAYRADKALAEERVLDAARPLLDAAVPLLTDDALDPKLMRIAILRHGSPAGLAEFAQQSPEHQALIDDLLADEELMRLVLAAGGANGGEYGEAMQTYRAILDASERAQERGTIFHNLALGTALHQPWLEDTDPQHIPGIVFTDHKNPDGQVARYLHYEQAYLDKELDPAFEDFNAWECRFITNDPYTNEELAWGRAMLRNFRPDHITTDDHKWRYTGLVKSDLPYCSTTHDDSLGLPKQQALALGGICGRRAFFGRFITRAFGIPARRSTQTGHAAMNKWTPDGWVVNLGAWWSMNWCGPQGGLDFLLDSQAREFPEQYAQVLRAQWIADALGEEDVSIRQLGKGGGFYNALAFYKKQAVVKDNEAAAIGDELAKLSAEEARLLGESDEILGESEIKPIEIAEKDKAITTAEDGTITVPAVALTRPDNNTEKVAFLDSFGGGMQLHYQRLGSRPEILTYRIEAPKAGKYELSAMVSAVSRGQNATFRINRRTIVEATVPYTKGMWQSSDPVIVELREGRNSIMLTFRAPNRGVSIKHFTLKPVE
jgi:hypothetical protein